MSAFDPDYPYTDEDGQRYREDECHLCGSLNRYNKPEDGEEEPEAPCCEEVDEDDEL